jgi:transcriptional regulator with XRE-family HTH domain
VWTVYTPPQENFKEINFMGRRTKFISITKESEALKKLRMLSGLSVRKLADELNVSHTLVSHLELGRANVNGAYIEKFLKTLNYSNEDWEIAVSGGKKSKSFVKNKMTEDCYDKLKNLSDEKLQLLHSILNGF